MLDDKLVHPKSIAVIGGSNDLAKPGGRVVKNLLSGSFRGELFIVNPKSPVVQGLNACMSPEYIPQPVDVAVLAIPANFCLPTVEQLISLGKAKNFIIFSAGFSELNEEGKNLEIAITKAVDKVGGCLIGPNCIGIMNTTYQAVFTSPVPTFYNKNACDLISGSGATAVFIMEAGIKDGLKLSSVYSVGNAAQTCVEDVVAYLDKNYNKSKSAKVKLLYFESIKKPKTLLHHALSLRQKGCKVVAIKAGKSEVGARAASSHTGALSTPNEAINCLFKKAGIINCDGREELINTAKILLNKELKGKNIAIISNAGGPAVMLTDILTNNGFQVPLIKGKVMDKLLQNLYPGASADNPIDLMATGEAKQLGFCIDMCEKELKNINAICVIFGNPGLHSMEDVYEVLDSKIKSCQKPIYVVLPSILSTKNEIQQFIRRGNVIFSDEVLMGKAMIKASNVNPAELAQNPFKYDKSKTNTLLPKNTPKGYLSQEKVYQLLSHFGIQVVNYAFVNTAEASLQAARKIGFPVAMKASGLLHKTELKAVSLHIDDEKKVLNEFKRLNKIKGAKAVEIAKMTEGLEFFIGVKKEATFGHLLMCGMGGIYVEVLKDIKTVLLPANMEEAKAMIQNLKMYSLIKGFRGNPGFDENLAAEAICKISTLVDAFPMISELDINPFMGKNNMLIAVDARIKI